MFSKVLLFILLSLSSSSFASTDYFNWSFSKTALSVGEKLIVEIRPNYTPDNEEYRLYFESKIDNSSIPLKSQAGKVVFSKIFSSVGTYTVSLSAYVENGQQVDSIIDAVGKIDRQISLLQGTLDEAAAGIEEEIARLTSLRFALLNQLQGKRSLVASKSQNVTVQPAVLPPEASSIAFFVIKSGSPVEAIIAFTALAGRESIGEVEYIIDQKTIKQSYDQYKIFDGIKQVFTPGSHDIKLTLVGTSGKRGPTISRTVNVQSNSMPIPSVTSTAVEDNPLKLRFDASATVHPDGANIAEVRWLFPSKSEIRSAPFIMENIFPEYKSSGGNNYDVRLRLFDSKLGRQDTFIGVQVNSENVAIPRNIPSIVYSLSAVSGPAPLSVNFDASRSFNLGGQISKVRWSFDDVRSIDRVRSGAVVSHTFKYPGVYSGYVEAVSDIGAKRREYFRIFVTHGSEQNIAPKIYMNNEGNGVVQFEPRVSLGGYIDDNHTYWDFGDGSPLYVGRGPSHVYNLGALYEKSFLVKLWTLDIFGNQHYTQKNIRVSSVGKSYRYLLDQPLNIGIMSNFNTTVTDNGNAAQAVSFLWNFKSDEVFQLGSVSEVYSYSLSGIHSPMVLVTDADGNSKVTSKLMAVNNGAGPLAKATAYPRSGDFPLAVTFDASDSQPGAFPIQDIIWDTDDYAKYPESFVEQNINSYTYTQPGIYYPLLAVRDVQGEVSLKRMRILVTDPSEPEPETAAPEAFFLVNTNSLAMTFDASASTGDEIWLYEWSFGDGVSIQQEWDPVAQHTYQAPGIYTVTLRVVDKWGRESVANTVVAPAQTNIPKLFKKSVLK